MIASQETTRINLKTRLVMILKKDIISTLYLKEKKIEKRSLAKIIAVMLTLQQTSVAYASEDEVFDSNDSSKSHSTVSKEIQKTKGREDEKEEGGMILLDESHYEKAIEPLKAVTISKLLAMVVVRRQVAGKIFVNDAENPTTFYVIHPYGMSFLFGKTDDEKFNTKLHEYLVNNGGARDKIEWLQVFPDSWRSKIELLLGNSLIRKHDLSKDLAPNNDEPGKVVENTRVNFTFNREIYEPLKSQLVRNNSYKIVKVDRGIFEESGSVVPRYFWNNAEEFLRDGIGFSILCNEDGVDVVASTAFSSCVVDDMLEIGIETKEKYRGKGLALIVSSRLIEYCLEAGFKPVWSCRLENIGSYKLAQKLGFIPDKYLSYYKLNSSIRK